MNHFKNHKRIHLVAFLVASITLSLFFGFVPFNHTTMAHTPSDCIAAKIVGMICPTNMIDFASHHLSAAKAFGEALISQAPGVLFPIVFLFASVLTFLFFIERFRLQTKGLYFHRKRYKADAPHSHRENLISWLSFLENSPSLSSL